MASQIRNPEFLENRPIGLLLLQFSAPSIIASTVSASYNFIARIFVGQKIGSLGIAALTVSFPFMLISLAVAMMIGTGASTLISIHLGRKETDKAEEILGEALFMYAALSAIFLVFGLLFLEPMLRLFGASDDVLPLAKSYLSIIIWGTIFQEISFGVNNFIRVEGKPNIAMSSMIMSGLLNLFFDWFFLFYLGTGIWGAAVSNIIAMATTSLWICWLYFSGKTILKWRLKYFRPHFALMGTIALFGTVPLVTQFCSAVIHAGQNYLLGFYGSLYGTRLGFENGGDLAIAVMGTVFSLGMLVFMPILGMSQGMQPIVGYNVGAKRPERVRHTLSLSLRVTFAMGIVFWGIILLRPDWFMIPFLRSDDPIFFQTLALGCRAMRLIMFSIPLVGINIIASGYFQAHGRPILSLTLTLLRQMIILLPCLFFLPVLCGHLETKFDGIYALDGVWGAYPLSDALACVVASIFLILEFRSKKKVIAEKKREASPTPL